MAKAKIVTISFGVMGNPDNRKIEHAINKWTRKGYTLKDRKDETHFTIMGPRTGGKTHLTFVKD